MYVYEMLINQRKVEEKDIVDNYHYIYVLTNSVYRLIVRLFV